MSGKYPSRKVGASIGFESRTLELSCIYSLEHSENVLLYLEQPPKLKLSYSSGGGKKNYLQTPDFVVVRLDGVAIIECKRLEVLEDRALADPELYVKKGGRWTCPPAEADAQRMGMRYELWTEADFSGEHVANLIFISDYLTPTVEVPGYAAALEAMKGLLASRARMPITALLSTLRQQGVCSDHLYLAMARGDVSVDLAATPLREHDACIVYRDRLTMAAFAACERTRSRSTVLAPCVKLKVGTQIDWDGKPWNILNVGTTRVTLHSSEGQQSLPISIIRDLVSEEVIKPLGVSTEPEIGAAAMIKLMAATGDELEEANRRLQLIGPYLNGSAPQGKTRTVQRYLARYRRAQQRLGNGYVGLIRDTARSGNRRARLRQDVLDVVNTAMSDLYLKATSISAKVLYGHIADRCHEASLPVPSYGWLCKFINKIPPEVLASARAGSKVAYEHEPRLEATELADATEPSRPFERAHIDHTLLDLETLDDDHMTGLGRMWITLMIDHVSRRVFGIHLTYAPPSYCSVMGVMRDCVRRFGRLPDSLVVDGGKEFRSIWFESTCAMYHVAILRRPPAKARYGSCIERYFGTLNTTLINTLSGNTQHTKNVRQMTNEVSPIRHAVWLFGAFYDVVEKAIFKVYDSQLEHRTLGMTPFQRFMLGMEIAGNRAMRLIAYDENFRILTCPSTPKGTAKVTADGVKINYFYYNAPGLRRHLGKSVSVRYDAEDMSRAYAHIDGAWVTLVAAHFAQELRYKTEHEIKLLTEEWRRRRSKVEKTRLTDVALIKFLKEVLETETLLKERRQAAQEWAHRQKREPERYIDADEIVSGNVIPGVAPMQFEELRTSVDREYEPLTIEPLECY